MLILTLAGLLLAQVPAPPPGTDAYTLGPDSMRQPNVPQGRVEGPFVFRSRLFEGTIREYWVYVPAQYDAATPAAAGTSIRPSSARRRTSRCASICRTARTTSTTSTATGRSPTSRWRPR